MCGVLEGVCCVLVYKSCKRVYFKLVYGVFCFKLVF